MVFNLLCVEDACFFKFTMTFHYNPLRKFSPMIWGSMNLKVTHIQFETSPPHPKRAGEKKIKEWGCAIDVSAPTQILKSILI